MKKIDDLEKELEEKFEDFKAGYKPFKEAREEMKLVEFETNKSSKQSRKRLSLMQTVAVAAACLLLFVTGGLTAYFTLRDGSPAYRYEDIDITANEYQESIFLTESTNLYLPDLSILSEKSYWIGKHNESNENVYFTIGGIFDDGISFRYLEFTVILKNEYHPSNETNYLNLENISIINENTVRYGLYESEFPFYSYYVAFATSNVRYYFSYTTIEEGDVETFFMEFLV